MTIEGDITIVRADFLDGAIFGNPEDRIVVNIGILLHTVH